VEWYKFVDGDVLITIMTESKQPLNVVNALRKFADKLEHSTKASEEGE
jgi:hypothetical protein